MGLTVENLKLHAIGAALPRETTLRRAIDRMGFVQADPIRSPARAQDLILRLRVRDYRVGDLNRRYHALKLEEDVVYAYGFMPRATRNLLHPRGERALTVTEERVLEIVRAAKRLHPRDLEAELGKQRELNGWGGYSKSTTRSLERLHHMGLIRVAGREGGVRLYDVNVALHEPLEVHERLRQLVLLVVKMLAPMPERSLRKALWPLRSFAPEAATIKSVLVELLQDGELTGGEVDGIRYVWAGRLLTKPPEDLVRFLAPFDPLISDRRRFKQLWGWTYQFEAYTPPLKRKLGYYAMPILWRTEMVGWVNLSVQDGELMVDAGMTREGRMEQAFTRAFDDEVERFRVFMGVR